MRTALDATEVLNRIRGALPPARANARSVAAMTENPGCVRRRVIDGARVRSYELAERLGHPPERGQSPFAITSGNQFERRLKSGSDYALLVEALQNFVSLPAAGLRISDCNKVPGRRNDAWLEARVKKTDGELAKIARGDADAPHIVDHPVLRFEFGGARVFLEPDALAFRVGQSQLELVEIKSYAIIDEQADPDKLAATAGQSAVYVLALEATLARLGFERRVLRESVLLVAPKNFGRTPVSHRIPLRKKLMALRRVERATGDLASVLESLPKDFTLDVESDSKKRDRALDAAVRKLEMRYVPSCLSSCDMGQYCRQQAVDTDCPSRLGREARDSLPGVTSLAEALRLAKLPKALEPGDRLADVAEALREAHGALQRARAASPSLRESTRKSMAPKRSK